MQKNLKKPYPSPLTSISGLSEISDNDNDFMNLSKKLQEKDEELEALRKEMRSLEYSTKKTQIELENEREYWKLKAETTQETLSSKPLMKLANELQQRLSEKEHEILSLKDSQLSLKRELFQIKENNLQLKNSNNILNKFHRPKSVSIEVNEKKNFLKVPDRATPSTLKLSMLHKIDEKAEFSKNTHEVLFGCIKDLKEENQALEENLNKIKDLAIESVVEKEKELIEMKNRFEEDEIGLKNQLELANNELEVLRMKLKYVEGDEEASSPKHANNLLQLRSLEGEMEAVKNLYREDKITSLGEREMLEQRIKELILENENQEAEFKRRLEKISKEMDDQIYDKVREDTQTSKDLQQEMLKELQSSEEKYREIQKKYTAAQQELRTLQKSLEKDKLENEQKIKDLTNKLKKYDSSEQTKLDLNKRNEGDKRKVAVELEQKQEKIAALEAGKLELAKKITYLESEINQVKMKNLLLKENCDNLKMENEELKTKSNEDFKNFQGSIAELDLKYSQEKDFLEMEVRRLKEMYEPEAARGTIYGTLRSEFQENPSEEDPTFLKPTTSDNRGSLSPSPQMRVSILETYDREDTIQKDEFERVVAESDIYIDLKNQIDEQNEKIEELTAENEELKSQMDRLIDSYSKEISDLKDHQKNNLTDLQHMRRNFIEKSEESAQEIEYNKEMKKLKMENLKLQTNLNENRQIFDNEVNFLKEENKRLETKIKGYKETHGKVVNERDLFMQKYNQIVTHIKKKKVLQNSESTGSLFGLTMSMFRK